MTLLLQGSPRQYTRDGRVNARIDQGKAARSHGLSWFSVFNRQRAVRSLTSEVYTIRHGL